MSTIAMTQIARKTNKTVAFAVKNGKVHRATCKRVSTDLEAMTAREALTLAYPTASCCKPENSPEWKATLETLRAENAALPTGIAGDENHEDVVAAEVEKAPKAKAKKAPHGTTHLTMVPVDEATAKAILALPVSERIAAGIAAGAKATQTALDESAAKKPAAKKAAPAKSEEHGETVDMGGKTVRAGGFALAYKSKTMSPSGKSIVRCEWATTTGKTIVMDRKDWTIDGVAVSVKNLTEAAALAHEGA